jgi:hypothetical protein
VRQRRHAVRSKSLHDLRDGPQPDVISVADMDTAVGNGQATAFSQVITFIRRYRAIWWLRTEVGWLPIPPPAAAVLDQHAKRMQHPAVKSATDHAVIRAVIELAREATKTAASSR